MAGRRRRPVRLGSHWFDAAGQPVPVAVDHRAGLGANLPRGDLVAVCGRVRTPAPLGTYTLRWDLDHEGLTWFAGAGDEALSLAVIVTDTIYPVYLPLLAP